ncbi:MAG: NADH-ubiquinone oxidoreductase-F iron-sulfur binding region domain-containing protein [bacterium]
MEKDIILKLKEANLLGRGGANFPTWIKWDSLSKNENRVVYIIANGSEGEPGCFKDEYIIKNYPEQFIEGIKIALRRFPHSEAIIYLNHIYFDKYKTSLEKYIGDLPITFFRKTARYIAGEETALMSHIEGMRDEPRVRPPYPTESGLYGSPTLVNNIETFYRVYEIANDKYKQMTFYSISGDVAHPGVFEFSEDTSIREILVKTKNWPTFDFFVQLGGGAAGSIFLPEELTLTKYGAASIVVHNRKKTDPYALMRDWAEFFAAENCDKCTPCRESSMRILKMVKERKLNFELLEEMFFVLEKTSFCPLGRGMPLPYKTLISKLQLEDK